MADDGAPPSKGVSLVAKSDEEIGRAIVEASRALNEALIDARHSKLEIEIDILDHAEPGLTWKSVSVHVWRKIIIA